MPAKTQAEIVSQMRQTLAVTEPDLDTSIGTTGRKILDAVGEVVSEAYVDRYLIEYQYDLDAKSGADLDDFVKLFGFNRLAARRATGTVVFERAIPAVEDILISAGTQISTEGSPPVVAATVVPAVLVQGDTSLSVPVQAVVGGIQGNVTANSLRRRVTPIDGINGFSNPAALTGGADAESDQQLRQRFKSTVFRNLAGTHDMFLAVALDDDAVTQANVVGAIKRRREQIEIVSGTATSSIQDLKYIYAGSAVLGKSIDTGDILTPGVHYSFNIPGGASPPTITVIDGVQAADGVYELEFEYVPQASRNDPTLGITNRVDVYVNGTRAEEATEIAAFQHAKVFTNSSADPLYRGNFRRSTNALPTTGNYFVRFGFSPVLDASVTNTIVIGAVTYNEGTDYFLVNDVSANGGTFNSFSGVEWVSQANGAAKTIPADMTPVGLDYVFNAVPRDVEVAIRAWRLMTTDVRVHQAINLLLNFHLAVIHESGYAPSSVQPSIEAAINNYISRVGFNGVVQVSDILDVVHGVPGVDAVRFLTSSDNPTNYAIQRVNANGDVLETYATNVVGQIRRATDVLLGDAEVPVFNDLVIVPRAQNTFGAV